MYLYIGTNVPEKHVVPTLRQVSAELMVRPVHCSVSANDMFMTEERKIELKMKEETLFFTNDLFAFPFNNLYCLSLCQSLLFSSVSCDYAITYPDRTQG